MTKTRAELWVFVVVAAAYAFMTAGGGEWMDAGELTAAAFTLGGAHPPGHPAHSLLGKLASLVPVGEVAFRVNLLSALCMAAAAAGAVALGRALVRDAVVPAVVGATLAALSPVVTTNATRAEVYGPVAALLVWATVLVVGVRRGTGAGTDREDEAPDHGGPAPAPAAVAAVPRSPSAPARAPAWPVLTAGFLCALAAAFQPLIAAAASLPLAIALATAVGHRLRRLAVPVLGLGVVALATYAYLPLRAHAASPPALLWGDPSSLDRLVTLLTAPAYQGNFALAGAAERFAGLWLLVGEGSGFPLLLLGTGGLAFAALTGLRGAGVVLATGAGVVAGAATQQHLNPDMPGYVTAAVFLCGAGLAPLVAAMARTVGAFAGEGLRQRAVHGLLVVPVAGLAFFGPTVRAYDGGSRRADIDGPREHFEATSGATPPGPAVYFANADHSLFPAMYEQLVAGARPDVAVGNAELARDIWFLRYVDGRVPDAYWPFVDDDHTDAVASRAVAGNLRAGRPVGGDEPAFGKLRPEYAVPRGRGYAYRLAPVGDAPDATPPPRYSGGVGERVAARVGLTRALFEATRGRLAGVAVAAGVADRFDADALARLRALPPQPLLYRHLPPLTPVLISAPWERDVVADDLAWRVGLALPEPGPVAPPERRLLRLWIRLLTGDADALADLKKRPDSWQRATRTAFERTLPPARVDALLGPAP